MKRLAVVGCGLRGNAYMRYLKPEMGREWTLAAIADPDEENRAFFREQYGTRATREFESGDELYEKTGDAIDAVVVATPNHQHRQTVIPAIERGLCILLEKPVAVTLDDLAAIHHAHAAAGEPPVAIGFVMRYISFYRKVKELLEAGAIGRPLTFEATELMGASLTALFMRGWRRLERYGGPLIAEKCSHDIDMLTWLAGARPVRVSSLAARTRFVPIPEAALHCHECALRSTCRYSIDKLAPYTFSTRPDSHPKSKKGTDFCVFNGERDIPDHQVVQFEFANGALGTFVVSMDQPCTNRTLRICGTDGQIVGSLRDDQVEIIRHHNEGYEQIRREIRPVIHDGSGHHGGDSVISEQFKSMLRGSNLRPPAGLTEGIEASLVCLAAEQSRHTHTVVNVDELRRRVFDAKTTPAIATR